MMGGSFTQTILTPWAFRDSQMTPSQLLAPPAIYMRLRPWHL